MTNLQDKIQDEYTFKTHYEIRVLMSENQDLLHSTTVESGIEHEGDAQLAALAWASKEWDDGTKLPAGYVAYVKVTRKGDESGEDYALVGDYIPMEVYDLRDEG